MTDTYNKLVRNGIPAIIQAGGDVPRTRVLPPEEYRAALQEKLLEEARECAQSTTPAELAGELADVLEVAYALAATAGFSPVQLEALRAEKHAARGGFEKRLMLLEVERHGK